MIAFQIPQSKEAFLQNRVAGASLCVPKMPFWQRAGGTARCRSFGTCRFRDYILPRTVSASQCADELARTAQLFPSQLLSATGHPRRGELGAGSQDQGRGLISAAQQLALSTRTLQRWAQRDHSWQATRTAAFPGRPLVRSARARRSQVLELLAMPGIRLDVPALRQRCPDMPRAELADSWHGTGASRAGAIAPQGTFSTGSSPAASFRRSLRADDSALCCIVQG